MTTANNQGNNLSPWQPGQSGNPSGRPRGTRDLAGYVLETTDAGRELIDALVSIARGTMPNVPVQEGCRPMKDQEVRPADQLATQLVHLTCTQAATQLQSLAIDGSNSAPQRPILDDLFLSECPACGNWAGWTGLIEEQRFDELDAENDLEIHDSASSSSTSQRTVDSGILNRILNLRKASDDSMDQVNLGVLMYCLVCSNQFLESQGALQDFLRHSPPTFIPGRRLSGRLE